MVLPVLRIIHDASVGRIFQLAGVTWHSADTMNTNIENAFWWELPDHSAFGWLLGTFIIVAKLESFLTNPAQVEPEEVLAYLPTADSCKWLIDRVFELTSTTGTHSNLFISSGLTHMMSL